MFLVLYVLLTMGILLNRYLGDWILVYKNSINIELRQNIEFRNVVDVSCSVCTPNYGDIIE